VNGPALGFSSVPMMRRGDDDEQDRKIVRDSLVNQYT
jgi:hypothetical protein